MEQWLASINPDFPGATEMYVAEVEVVWDIQVTMPPRQFTPVWLFEAILKGRRMASEVLEAGTLSEVEEVVGLRLLKHSMQYPRHQA